MTLLNELAKSDKMRGLPSILLLFRNEFTKFNNTGARILDSILHMPIITYKSHLRREHDKISQSFTQRYNGLHNVSEKL